LRRIAALDQRLSAAVRGVRILRAVALPSAQAESFLAAHAAGHLRMPVADYHAPDLSAARAELAAVLAAIPRTHPLSGYLLRATGAWHRATLMLEAVGTPAASVLSAQLYGGPQDVIPGTALSSAAAAREFVAVAAELGGELEDTAATHDIDAATLQVELRAALDAFFGVGVVAVELDAELAAKAAAGASRIRLRSGSRFSAYDRHQLLAHEAFVHTLTARNGLLQPALGSLARTSPHVTATQEGLAVYAELISGGMDLARLKRISLRILGIELALSGADFIEVFRFFLEQGRDAADSYNSTARIFRGVPLSGGYAFAKDTVYLHGLLSVHTFFRWALRGRRLSLLRRLFAGKMALSDALDFEPWFDAGFIAEPRYLPPWVAAMQGLAGSLAFSLFVNRIPMDEVSATSWRMQHDG
jgi:uncharacterized protein (TIGR02421 family)